MISIRIFILLGAVSIVSSSPLHTGPDDRVCEVDEELDPDTYQLSLLQTELKVVAPHVEPAGLPLMQMHVHVDHSPRQLQPPTHLAKGIKMERLASITKAGLLQDSSSRKESGKLATPLSGASLVARTVVWLHRIGDGQGTKGAAIGIVVVVVVVLGLLLMMMLLTAKQGNAKQDLLRPTGVGNPVSATSLLSGQSNLSAGRSPLLSSKSMMQSAPPTQQSLAPLDEAVEEMSSGKKQVPPICPSLILPHTEARFMVPIDSLQRLTTGTVDIMGTSGRKLLSALVCASPDGRRCVMLASCGCEDDPRTCTFTPLGVGANGGSGLEVFGKAGKFYGWLVPDGSSATLFHSGNGGSRSAVLDFELGDQDTYSIAVSTAWDGAPIASAGADDDKSWKLQANPGADAVLIASCMLALILLRPWAE